MNMVPPKYRGYKWQCLTTHGPSRQHSDPQQKFCVDQVTVPPNPPGKGRSILATCLGADTNRFSGLSAPLSPRGEGQDSDIVPVYSIAPEGWGPEEGGNTTSPLHSRGSPTKETKSEVKTYTRGHHDAPSISKYGSLVQPDAQIAALRYVRPLSAPPRRPPVEHGSQKMPGAHPARQAPPRAWGVPRCSP